MSLYYVLSLKWTKRRDAVLTFWGPNNSGYVFRLESAGKYTEAQIKALRSYYDDGETTRAVPCEEVEKLSQRVGDTESRYLDFEREPDQRVVGFRHLTKLRGKWLS